MRLPHFCLLALAASLSALTAGLAAAPPQAEVKTLAIGASAPDFDLPGTDGKNHRLSDYAEAEVLAIVFLCNHCPSAQGAESRVEALIAANAEKSFQLVAISPNDPLSVRVNELGYSLYGDTLAEMKLHAAEYGLTYPYLYSGTTDSLAESLDPEWQGALPHTVLLAPGSKVLHRFSGEIDPTELRRVIVKTLGRCYTPE